MYMEGESYQQFSIMWTPCAMPHIQVQKIYYLTLDSLDIINKVTRCRVWQNSVVIATLHLINLFSAYSVHKLASITLPALIKNRL